MADYLTERQQNMLPEPTCWQNRSAKERRVCSSSAHVQMYFTPTCIKQTRAKLFLNAICEQGGDKTKKIIMRRWQSTCLLIENKLLIKNVRRLEKSYGGGQPSPFSPRCPAPSPDTFQVHSNLLQSFLANRLKGRQEDDVDQSSNVHMAVGHITWTDSSPD